MSPVDLIAVLYLAERTRALVALGKIPVAVPVCLAGVIAIPLAAMSGLATLRARNAVHGKVQIASFLGHLGETSADPLRLWFPHTSPYWLMEFATLLEYKGVHVVSDSAPGERGPRVVLESPANFPMGRCLSYRTLPCARAMAPGSRSLIVVTPNDEPAEGVATSLRPDGPALFEYRPFAPNPTLLRMMMQVAGVFAPRARAQSSRSDVWEGYVSSPVPAGGTAPARP